MRILDNFYAVRPVESIFHYTDSVGLYAILTTKNLRATHIQFLNDSSEFRHALALIVKRIGEAIVAARDDEIVEMLTVAKEGLENITPNTFVISFSEHRDVLSQWRGYCPNGGYNIAFSPGSIVDLAERNHFAIVRCQYGAQAQSELVNALVQAAIDEYPSFRPAAHPDPNYRYTSHDIAVHFFASWLWNKTQRLASAIKNGAFEEEGEWRLIGGLKGSKRADDFRAKGALLVPYKNFDISLDGSLDEVVTGVTIGPTAHQSLARHSIETFQYTFLKDTRLEIVQSVAPYRTL